MVYPWTVTDNVNFIIGYLMGQWKIAIEAFFVICTFINNGKGAVSAGYFIENKYTFCVKRYHQLLFRYFGDRGHFVSVGRRKMGKLIGVWII